MIFFQHINKKAFSLHYIPAILEYTEYSGDKTLAFEEFIIDVTDKAITISAGDNCYLWTLEGTTVVNTTDAQGSWDGRVENGETGTSTVNYIQ